MKLLSSMMIVGMLVTRAAALEPAELAAVTKAFNNPSGDDQYNARIELNRLIDQATRPNKGDPAAVTRTLVLAIQAQETPQEARKYLLRALGRVGTAEAVPALVPMLARGTDPLLMEEARSALQSIHDPKAVAALEDALRRAGDKREKLGLIDSLACQRAASSVPILAPLVLDPDPETARAALIAITKIGGPPAFDTLSKALSSGRVPASLKADLEMAVLTADAADGQGALRVFQSTKSDWVKAIAFMNLMRTQPADAKPALIEQAMSSASTDLRHAAIAAGIQANLPGLQSKLASGIARMPKDDRLIVLANLHFLKPVAAAEQIALGLAASADEDERINALAALGRIGTKAAFDPILQALGAREPKVNQAAATALAGMSLPTIDATLLAMLKADASADKILALKAMLSRNLPDSGAILLTIIKGADAAASKEAMKTIYFLATIEDLRTLCAEAKATGNPELKRSLASTCSRIATRINTDEAKGLVKALD